MSQAEAAQTVAETTSACDLSIVGNIVTSDEAFVGEVRVIEGVVAEVHHAVTSLPFKTRRVLRRQLLLPGFVDAHVHLGTTEVDGLTLTSQAAAVGGITTLIDMPFDTRGVVNSVEALCRKGERISLESRVDVALLGTV